MPLPRSIRVLADPDNTFRDVLQTNTGFGAVFGILAVEFALVSPVSVARAMARLFSNPVTALTSLWSHYVGYALSRGVLVFIIGTLLYYLIRTRGPRVVDIWGSASMIAYAWVPQTLVMALSVTMAHLGFRWAILPHYGYADVSLAVQAGKVVIQWGPSTYLAYRAVRIAMSLPPKPEQLPAPEPSPLPRVRAAALAMGLVLASSAALVTHGVVTQWEKVRPVVAGDPLPDFQLTSLEGDTIQPSELAGKVVLLDFWATWCGPCVASMPHLEQLHRELGPRGFELVSINAGPESREKVQSFLESHELTFDVYPDSGQRMQNQFGVQTFPTAFLVDQAGRISEVHIGVVSMVGLRGQIEDLLEGAGS